MDKRVEEEILTELALTANRREDRELARRILKAQRVLRRHADDRGWTAFLELEKLAGERAYSELVRAIRIAFRRGLCTSRDDS